MKQSHFIALISYSLSTLVLALGVCMMTLAEWHLQTLGMPISIIGVVLLIISYIYQQKRAQQPLLPSLSAKTIGQVAYVVIAILTFGGGFALVTLGNLLLGSLVSILGIILLIGIIPLVIGIKKG
ncbi:hypothetical protein [Streptococcus sp. zg-JUN1979]|uniref:hypothetical protein n=1 Tax=Streptococcus sp. zg-JUN1979 TaxID=3391450 RepID=UPI0039A5725C